LRGCLSGRADSKRGNCQSGGKVAKEMHFQMGRKSEDIAKAN
jgi:hypothetical protein